MPILDVSVLNLLVGDDNLFFCFLQSVYVMTKIFVDNLKTENKDQLKSGSIINIASIAAKVLHNILFVLFCFFLKLCPSSSVFQADTGTKSKSIWSIGLIFFFFFACLFLVF